MHSEFIKYERHDETAIVRLNRPEKLNALSPEMIATLSDLFSNFKQQSDLRAVILTGINDKAFCAGTDISEIAIAVENAEDREQRAREISERGQTLCNVIEECGVPVIAAINGIAAGGGCELALACHLRVAADNAQFSLPETKLGVLPAYGGSQRLSREIGEARALEIMLTGRRVGAEEALQFGLVNRVTSAANSLNEALALANEIAQLAPLAIRACLQAVIEGQSLPLKEGLALETKLFAGLFETNDVREGTRAFLEKRRPLFKGA
jgi:enoyl-CoA hydratase